MTDSASRARSAVLDLRQADSAVVLLTYRGDWWPYCCGQLVKLASMNDRIAAAGAEVIALSVDSEERNAAMFARWPTPHVQYVSDPAGDQYLKALDLYDPEERGGIALPALLVLDADGNEVVGYRGDDFADRRNDDDVIEALESVGIDAVQPVAGGPVDDGVDERQKGAFTPKMFAPYFMGNRFGAAALRSRLDGEKAKTVAKEHQEMAEGMLEAWNHLTSTAHVADRGLR